MRNSREELTGKTARTLLAFVLLAAAPYLLPGMERMRVLLPERLLAALVVWHGPATVSAASATPDGEPGSVGEAEERREAVGRRPGAIEDPSGHALDHFLAALARAEAGEGRVRVCHYGDSPITADGITSTARRRLQERFGDAGHGFVLIDRPWGWYQHSGVTREASAGWQSDPISPSGGDRCFGLGGVSFTTTSAGVTAAFGTAEEGTAGRAVSSFDLYYLEQPGGGDLSVEVDGEPRGRVSTAAEATRSGFLRVDVAPEGAHRLAVRTEGNGEVRMFGVVLEAGSRGLEYDSLGVNGAYVGLLANRMDADHWAEQLRHRQPDLVVVGYGANESEYEALPMDLYERDTREVIARIRAAVPEASILFMGPMDRAMRGRGGALVTRPMIPRLVAYQRRIAAETGCAFFDTYAAMGGEGTAARWCEARPRLMGGDFTHPTAQGSEIVGTLLSDAILGAYADYRKE